MPIHVDLVTVALADHAAARHLVPVRGLGVDQAPNGIGVEPAEGQ